MDSSAAHEARTQLHGLILSLRLLRKKAPADPVLAVAFRSAEEQGHRAVVAFEHLLDSMDLPSPRSALLLDNHAPGEILSAAVGQVSALAAEKRQPVILPADLAHLPPVTADRALLIRAIVHLLENAIKFSSRDEPIEVSACLRSNDGHPSLIISVKDRGFGIPPAVADRLLLPGSQREGMGLASARQIIEAHHGRLWVEIKSPPGATFSFSLPISSAPLSFSDSAPPAHATTEQRNPESVPDQSPLPRLAARIADFKASDALGLESRRLALELLEEAVLAGEEAARVNEALRKSEAWLDGLMEAFQAAVRGAPLETSLDLLARTAVRLMGHDVRCAFYLADEAGRTLRCVAGTSAAFAECAEGLNIGPDSLAGGLAVFEARPVITPDVMEDERWKPWRDLAGRHDCRGCWAFPIETEERVVGSLVLYFSEPRGASPGDHEAALVLTRAAALLISRQREAEERIRAQRALRLSDDRMRMIVENAREHVIFSTDLDRRVTTWNVGAERILGFSESEILGQTADIIFTPEDRAAGAPEKEARIAIGEGRASDERWHLRKNGERFWGSGVMMAMRNDAGQVIGLLKIFRDETDALRARQELESSREQLLEALQENQAARAAVEASSKAKDHFLALLSHELRTPLAPILLALKLLERQVQLTPAARDKLDLIRRNIHTETLLIDDLLDMTRIEHGKFEISPGPVDFHQVVTRAVEVTAGDIEQKAQRLTVALDARNHRFQGDATKLQQVVWNLLKNASKFTPREGAITVSTRNIGPTIVLLVRDSGVGISAGALPLIFDAFAQCDITARRQFGGLGLGLAISRSIVDAHHGTIHAASDGPGHGSAFTVELPLLQNQELPPG